MQLIAQTRVGLWVYLKGAPNCWLSCAQLLDMLYMVQNGSADVLLLDSAIVRVSGVDRLHTEAVTDT